MTNSPTTADSYRFTSSVHHILLHRWDSAHSGVASILATASTDLSTAWFLSYVPHFPDGDFPLELLSPVATWVSFSICGYCSSSRQTSCGLMWLLVSIAGYRFVIQLTSCAIHFEQVFSAQKIHQLLGSQVLFSPLQCSHRVIWNVGHQLMYLLCKEHGEVNWILTIYPWQEDLLYGSTKIKL